MKKETIYAVHDRDLEALLKRLNLLDRVKNGEIRCELCNCVVSLGNIGFISSSRGEIEICCDNPKCYYNFMMQKGSGRN